MKYGFESEKSRYFPLLVQLSITNICDMACVQCPHSDYAKLPDYKPSFLQMSLFRKIVDEIGRHQGSLRLLGWGEALMHPELGEMVAYAKKKGVLFVNLITNGLRLDRKISRKLILGKLDVLEVSLDAFTEETYRAIRNNPSFKKIKENIFDFLKLRDELGGETYVVVGIIDQPKAHGEIEDFKKFWLGKVEDVIIRTYRDFKGYVKERILLPAFRHPCRCLWARFNINSDGKVSVCYDDWRNENIVADLNEKGATIEKIWQSEKFDEYRQAHLKGKPFGICEKCNDWIASSWEKPYELVFEKVECWRNARKKK